MADALLEARWRRMKAQRNFRAIVMSVCRKVGGVKVAHWQDQIIVTLTVEAADVLAAKLREKT